MQAFAINYQGEIMNPFELKPISYEKSIVDFKELASKPYNKDEVSPFTKLRVILMNGTEFEAVKFGHHFNRCTADNDLRRELAKIRNIEQFQQKRIAGLKPANESQLEHTIGYEQLAVELTAILAQREPNAYVKEALDFALLEDFDHLYRYSDLLDMDEGIHAERLVGELTEIMPARPTISHHRHPYDNVRYCTNFKNSDPITVLNTMIITAAEQQTMNYYMNLANFYNLSKVGKDLYNEIAMVEEEHVTQYGDLLDPNCTPLENLLMHEYCECYLYYSCYQDETDKCIKSLFEQIFEQEVAHLHMAKNLLQKYEGKDFLQVIPNPKFPELLKFSSNKEYVRQQIVTANMTAEKENYVDSKDLDKKSDFYQYQSWLIHSANDVPSHKVIDKYIDEHGQDYRYMDKPSPIKELNDRKKDDTCIGRVNACK